MPLASLSFSRPSCNTCCRSYSYRYKRSSCPLSSSSLQFFIIDIILVLLFQISLQTGLPVGSIPFVLTTWMFIGLGKSSDGVFNYPITVSSPERQRQEFLSRRRTTKLDQVRSIITFFFNIYMYMTSKFKLSFFLFHLLEMRG